MGGSATVRPPMLSRSARGREIRASTVAERMRGFLVIAFLIAASSLAMAGDVPASPLRPARVETRQAHAIFRITPRLYSGAQPEWEAAFAELARMGVRTLVSVDGARPDVAAARRHGLRYVHLPIGYDGISTERTAQLVKAISELPTPLYVHCHHGQHRGPAAVAVMAMAREGWSSEEAVAWMRQAGTSTNYPGLYGVVRQFRCPDAQQIHAAGELPETAVVPARVTAMVDIDARWSRLKAWQQRAWKPVSGDGASTLHQEALQLWEAFQELGRQDAMQRLSADYRRRLALSQERAKAFLDEAAKWEPSSVERLDSLARGLAESCTGCHREHRD